MAQWEARGELYKLDDLPDEHRQYLTLNLLYDTKAADFVDEKVHPVFYKGMTPIYVGCYNINDDDYRHDTFRGVYGFYCYYNSRDGLTGGQLGFNPPNAKPGPHNPDPLEVDWVSDDELKEYTGPNYKKPVILPVATLDSSASSYLGMVIATGHGTWSYSQTPTPWEEKAPFYSGVISSRNGKYWTYVYYPGIAILKASGYGSYENRPMTSFEDVKGGDKTKTEWKSFKYDSELSTDLPTFSKNLAQKLNDDKELSGLHPLQMKVAIFLSGINSDHYTAVVFYTDAYASTAPQNFIVQEGDDKNNMLLPYSPYYKTGNGDLFKRWCWIQQSRNIKHGPAGRRDHAFRGESSLIATLERLPPAQQFLAQVSGTQEYEPALFYLNYPLAYYEGYKKIKHDEFALAKRAANKSDQQFIFLNLTVDDIEVYVASSSAETDDNKVHDDAICTRNTYLTKGYFHKGPNNSTFKVTKKGDSDTVIGRYQAVDTPDLHDYYITIIIEPK